MTATPSPGDDAVARSVQRYRRFLWLYPAAFREEFGDDLVQTHRDLLLFNSGGRRPWWRTTHDLIVSAARERVGVFAHGPRPSWRVVAGVVAIVLAFLLVGGTQLLLVPAAVLVALPLVGFARFRHAWVVRRSTGGHIGGDVAIGLACIAPAAVFFAIFRGDAGYWVFIAVSGTLIVSATAGIVWAAVSLIRRPVEATRGRWVRPVLVLIPSLAVLGFIIGASVNSYLRTIGPAGDHSVENASSDTRSLWFAAGAGDLDSVIRITTHTCADPWVRFTSDEHGNHENARGHAIVRGPHEDVESILDEYMDDWDDRCAETDE